MATARSARVIEQLQDDFEHVQKELVSTRDQLDISREDKEKYEKQNRDHVQSNTECRAKIQELMQVLESKQQQLDTTKKDSLDREEQVKTLKDAALEARRQSDHYKQREGLLKCEREAALYAKEQTIRQKEVLHQSIQAHDTRLQQELASLQDHLQSLRKHTILLSDRCTNSIQYFETQLQAFASEHKRLQEDHSRVHTQLASATQERASHVQNDIRALQDVIKASIERTEASKKDVVGCRDEMNGLKHRIQAHSEQLCNADR